MSEPKAAETKVKGIEPVKTAGEMPGWIQKHCASYESNLNATRISGGEIQVVAEDGKPQLVPNEHQFELDITRLQWRRTK